MATISAIRTAIKTTVTTAVTTLNGYDQIADAVNFPALIIMPRDSNFLGAMGRGLDAHTFDLYLLASYRDAGLAQAELDKYVTGAGATSVRQAIWNARTLGLADTDATVSGMRGYGAQYEVGDVTCLGAILELVVRTSGTA